MIKESKGILTLLKLKHTAAYPPTGVLRSDGHEN